MTHYNITPIPKPRMTRRDKWLKPPRKCVARYRAFADECRLKKVEIPQPCQIVFMMPMPKSWTDKKRSKMNGKPHLVVPDIDNLQKALFDAVYKNDSHIWNVWAIKIWSELPGIEITPI